MRWNSPSPVISTRGSLLLFVALAVACGDGDSNAPHTASEAGTTGSATQGVLPTGLLLTDVTADAGIDFRHDASEGMFYIIEEMGSGGALFDADGDGDLDLYLVQGGRIPRTEIGELRPNQLFENQGDGTFVDVTEASGAGDTGYGMGAAIADVDGDGDLDIYVTNVGADSLLINDGTGRFSDESAAFGLGDAGHGCSAAFADFDGDGWLDLYVSVYVPWSVEIEMQCFAPDGKQAYCNPTNYPAGQDRLYRNVGGARFEDVTVASGIAGHPAYGLGVVCCDFDKDGHVDIYVANDHQPNMLWHNLGDGRFEDVAFQQGCAYNGLGAPEASMGLVCEDLDRDGDYDLLLTHFHDETNTYYRNDGAAFRDVTTASLFGRHGLADTSFGTGLIDIDNDGQFEVLIANGAVMRYGNSTGPENPYAEPNRMLALRDGRFSDISERLGPDFVGAGMSRGAIFGDYDNDGDVDVVICNNRGPARLLRNDTPRSNHWIQIALRADGGNRAALGASVSVETSQGTWQRLVAPHSSYLSSNDPRLHYGLGARTETAVTVRWPDGEREHWESLAADQVHLLERGTGKALKAAERQSQAGSHDPGRAVSKPHQPPAGMVQLVVTPYPQGAAMAAQVKQLIDHGDFQEAIVVAKAWLDGTLRELSLDHSEVVRATAVLAALHSKAGAPTAAVELYEQRIRALQDAGREYHPALVRFHSDLGKILGRLGRADALAQLREALRLSDAMYSPNSPQSLGMRTLLSRHYLATGQDKLAEAILIEAYAAGTGLSEARLDLLQSAGQIAQSDDRYLDAVHHYDTAMLGFQQLLGDHAKTAAVQSVAGDCYVHLRDYNRALERFAESARIRKKVLGPDDLATLTVTGQLGATYTQRGDFELAERTIRMTLKNFERLRGPDDLYVASTRRNLADLYVALKKPERALEVYAQVLQVFERILHESDPSLRRLRQSIKNLRASLGRK